MQVRQIDQWNRIDRQGVPGWHKSVKRQTLDLGSGHDLVICEIKPRAGLCADSAEPAWDSLSAPSLLSLSQNNKHKKKKEQRQRHILLSDRSTHCVWRKKGIFYSSGSIIFYT